MKVEPSERVTSCVNVYGLLGRRSKVAWRRWVGDIVVEEDNIDWGVVDLAKREFGRRILEEDKEEADDDDSMEGIGVKIVIVLVAIVLLLAVVECADRMDELRRTCR
jgi:hypothetical protein